MNINLAKELNECYIEYVNDFLTLERYAMYKGWSLFFAKQVINSGRKINQIKQALLYSIKYSGAMNVKNEYLHKLYNQACKLN